MQPFLDIFLSVYSEISQFKYADVHLELSTYFFIWTYYGDQNELLLVMHSEWWPILVHQLVDDLSHSIESIRDNAFSTTSCLTQSSSNVELLKFLKTPLFDMIELQMRSRTRMMKMAVVILMNLLLSGLEFVDYTIRRPSLMDSFLAIICELPPNDEMFQNALEGLTAIMDCKDNDQVVKFFLDHLSLLDVLGSKISDRGQIRVMFKIQTAIRSLFEIGQIYTMRMNETDNPFVERVSANPELREKIEQGMHHVDNKVKTAFQSLVYIYFDVSPSK